MANGAKWVKVTMFFPLFDNSKPPQPFDGEVWRWWRRKMIELGIDFSEMGRAGGTWLGHNDTNKWIMTVVSEDQIPKIQSFLREARVKFNQKTMYLDFHPVSFELIK